MSANFSFSAGIAIALLISALSFVMMALGTPTGATMPVHVVASYPATPASATVGSSGSADERAAPLTASPRTRPDFAYGAMEFRLSIIN